MSRRDWNPYEAPPDSGERCCDLADKGHRAGCPGKPNSGEREVQADLAEMRRFWASAVAADSETAKEVMLVLDELERHRAGVYLDLPLAQRILAALEGNGNAALRKALAAELRAMVTK